jgi:hypothetical protein
MPIRPVSFEQGSNGGWFVLEEHGRRAIRFVIATSCTVAVAWAGACPALAAGSGYGGTLPPVNNQPTGFRTVIIARIMGKNGGSVNGEVAAGPVEVVVPKRAYKKRFQVAITKGSAATVKKDLARSIAKRRVVTDFGIEIKSGASSITTSKALTVIFSDLAITRGCIVAVYDSRTGKFTKVRATVTRGKVSIRIKSGESIAILAQPGT